MPHSELRPQNSLSTKSHDPIGCLVRRAYAPNEKERLTSSTSDKFNLDASGDRAATPGQALAVAT
jgi:hypothetical protein